jgi:cell division septation protein DedD
MMREKIFYVINLDKKRIAYLTLFLAGLLSSFFFLGVSIGKTKSQQTAQANQNTPGTSPIQTVGSDKLSDSDKNTNLEDNPISQSGNTNENSPETASTEESGSGEIRLANRGTAGSGLASGAKKEIIRLDQKETGSKSIPGEDVNRQEEIYKEKPAPQISQKSTPKSKTSDLDSRFSSGIYSIQLAAFSQKSQAESYQKKLSQENPKYKGLVFITKKGNYYLVRVGKSNQKEDLQKLLAKLKLSDSIRKGSIIVKNS